MNVLDVSYFFNNVHADVDLVISFSKMYFNGLFMYGGQMTYSNMACYSFYMILLTW